MKKIILLFATVLFLFPISERAIAGVPGVTNRVPAATLLVPFFEVGVTSVQDTLLVVNNVSSDSSSIIHYEVWDIDGHSTKDLFGNITLGPRETWSVSMANLVRNSSAETKSALRDGSFYRGFVTIDRVTSATDLQPYKESYPFSNSNYLEGYMYYVRLLEGSANGLAMVPIEYVGTSVNSYLRDFYQNSDGREEIDSDARKCASSIMNGDSCSHNDFISQIDSRVFLNPSTNASSRIIIFSGDPEETGGPSVYCNASGNCPNTYVYQRYDEGGNLVEDTMISLDHVVNVIDVSGTENGWVSIKNVPSSVSGANFQIYAFSFNSASSSSASTNWDAIFESYILP